MKTLILAASLLFSQLALSQSPVANRNPIFGVYRGLSSPTQSCTLTILEQRPANVAAVLIDQNPYIFVSLTQFTDLITNTSARAAKTILNSTEPNRPGNVEFILDAKGKLTEAHLTFNGVTALCSHVFLIRKQD